MALDSAKASQVPGLRRNDKLKVFNCQVNNNIRLSIKPKLIVNCSHNLGQFVLVLSEAVLQNRNRIGQL